MKTVMVIMSTYNGEENIERQLDSIFDQVGVNIEVVIRDDQSTDNTVNKINLYAIQTGKKIKLIEGKNEGYAKSFWDALCLSGEADYYAFSDQDDIWKKDKILKCINVMNTEEIPQLSYCKMTRCDSDLNEKMEQVNVLQPKDLTKKLVLTQTFNYGAATVINQCAKELICRCWPDSCRVPHDLWAGLLCLWFGKVYYVDENLYYWVRYRTSVTGAGNKYSGIVYRLRETIKGHSYDNVSGVLLDNYSDLLNQEDMDFLVKLRDYKKNIKYKMNLLLDKEFKRKKLQGTIMLKIGILFNRF